MMETPASDIPKARLGLRGACGILAAVFLFGLFQFVALGWSTVSGAEILVDDSLQGWNLFVLPLLTLAFIYFAAACLTGQFFWLARRRFSLLTLLGAVFLFSIVTVAASPGVRWILSRNAARVTIMQNINKIEIRDAGRELLDLSANMKDKFVMLSQEYIPGAISKTRPSQVTVYKKGWVIIHYGSESNVGIVIVREGETPPMGEKLMDGMSYFEN